MTGFFLITVPFVLGLLFRRALRPERQVPDRSFEKLREGMSPERKARNRQVAKAMLSNQDEVDQLTEDLRKASESAEAWRERAERAESELYLRRARAENYTTDPSLPLDIRVEDEWTVSAVTHNHLNNGALALLTLTRTGTEPQYIRIDLGKRIALDHLPVSLSPEKVKQVIDALHTKRLSGLGAVGYSAYGNFTEWKTFDGRDMPQWEKLSSRIQMAWQEAAFAIHARGSKL